MVELLGLVMNTREGKLTVTGRRVTNFRKCVTRLLQVSHATLLDLASVVGHTLSMSTALGPGCSLQTLSLYAAINARQSWSSLVPIGGEARK